MTFPPFFKQSNKHFLLLSILTALLLLTFPLNIFVHSNPDASYVRGVLVDYLLLKWYLSDFFLLGIVGWGMALGSWGTRAHLLAQVQSSRVWWLGLASLVLWQFFTPQPLVSVAYLGTALLIISVGVVLYREKNHLSPRAIGAALFLAFAWQIGLVCYQTLQQQALLPWMLSGEPNFSEKYSLARTTLWGAERILPYGSTPHPNVAAGVVVVLGLLLLNSSEIARKPWLSALIVALAALAVFLTQSASAGLTLALGLLFHFTRWKPEQYWAVTAIVGMGSLIILTTATFFAATSPSLTRRAALAELSLQIWRQHPFIGTGFQHFTPELAHYDLPRQLQSFIQPVHHAGLLILSETGLLGAVLITALLCRYRHDSSLAKTLAILSPILFWDHYLLTTHGGLVLLTLMMVVPTLLGTGGRHRAH
jgi:hypothetical protein